MYSANRSHRAETRNRTKDELRKVISSIEKVRKWEKKWVLIKDTQIKIQKWVPGKLVSFSFNGCPDLFIYIIL
ncbi:unnamed protein product [Angiostrongylus costaricensis]|uniref:B-cell CLL/lymphoma 7 protein family member A n=1 Tax=Angiostrongylus costaricensis TaxID=334426 RepID=A0A0R3PKI0_ANGCS|nr:unnamed protein product [Angiostrongylus costaricensis]